MLATWTGCLEIHSLPPAAGVWWVFGSTGEIRKPDYADQALSDSVNSWP